MVHLDDNIAAIASARGSGARGIVRASGPTVVSALGSAFQTAGSVDLAELLRPIRLEATLCVPDFSTPLPGALHVWPTSRSYTGEPLLEWHTLGSTPLLEAALRALCQAGARLAEPGEFTLRAFLAGRLDLTQAEAVLGVIDAHTGNELHTALTQLAGGLAQPLSHVRHDLVDLLVDLEAGLDFAEEGIDFVGADEVLRRLHSAADEIATVANQMVDRGDSTHWPRVVLRGWPNTGKSSLFNALVERATALVSEREGTTRDYLQAAISCGTSTCQLIDTAGVMPHAEELLDRAAQGATRRQIEQAELELLCLDATRPLNPWERTVLAEPLVRPRMVILTKGDNLAADREREQLTANFDPLLTSSRTGEGLDTLRQRIAATLSATPGGGSSVITATAQRAREAIDQAGAAMTTAIDAARHHRGEELIAAEIRAALAGLGSVVGAVYTDELLDGIFSRFCIGK